MKYQSLISNLFALYELTNIHDKPLRFNGYETPLLLDYIISICKEKKMVDYNGAWFYIDSNKIEPVLIEAGETLSRMVNISDYFEVKKSDLYYISTASGINLKPRLRSEITLLQPDIDNKSLFSINTRSNLRYLTDASIELVGYIPIPKTVQFCAVEKSLLSNEFEL